MSPSYSVPLAMEGGPKNGPVPVKVNSDAPVAAETTAMLLPSPDGDDAAGRAGHAAEHEAVGEAVAPDERAGRRIQCVQGAGAALAADRGGVAADVERGAVERRRTQRHRFR